MKIRTAASLALGILALSTFGGCAWTSNVMRGIADRIEHKQELADIRYETKRRLADERQEALRSDSRIGQLESQLCNAGQEALQRQVEAQIKDKVDSQVAFNVSQGLEVGELEVDVEALQKLLDKRKTEALQKKPVQKGPHQKGPFQKSSHKNDSLQKSYCDCDEQECGCRPGLLKKFCHHCKHKKCNCEKDCGGPEALQRLAQEPLTKPLRPTEIPMKLPVRLTIGMENPRVLKTRVRQDVPQEALQRVGDKSKGGGSGGSEDPDVGCPPQVLSIPLPPVPVPDDDFQTTSLERLQRLPFQSGYSTSRGAMTRPVSFDHRIPR